MSHTATKPGQATHCDVDALNGLLRGEISAVETYEQAIQKFSDPDVRTMQNALTRIRDEHTNAVSKLRDRVQTYGGTPSDGSGVWGTFAKAVEGAAKLVGPQTALAALKQGEQHGIDDYEKALNNADVSAECKSMIRSDLMPKCRDHITALTQMIDQLERKAGG